MTNEPQNPAQPPVPPQKESIFTGEVTRRGFVTAAWAALLGFFAAGAAGAARFMFPNVLYEPSQRFKLGKAKDLPLGVTTNKKQRIWVIRNDDGIYAIWSRCTHLGCTPNWFQAESRFRCPCHGSNFDIEGDVIAGPAPKPLWRVAVATTPDGDLVIDKSLMENRPGFRDKGQFFVAV